MNHSHLVRPEVHTALGILPHANPVKLLSPAFCLQAHPTKITVLAQNKKSCYQPTLPLEMKVEKHPQNKGRSGFVLYS